MIKKNHIALDCSVAVLLAVALAVVYFADQKGLSSGKVPGHREPREPEVVEQTQQTVLPARLAVTPKSFDDMGKLLESLGAGYRFEVVDEPALLDPAIRSRFDAIFLTCAEPKRNEVSSKLAASLREFVSGGGTLYASDLRFDTLAAAFPELVDRPSVSQGVQQNLRAQVVAPELREILGAEMPLQFDLDGWRPAAFKGDDVTVYLRGRLRTTAGVDIDAPLLVKFPSGKGNVLFTSFHNEKQNSSLETKLLKHLVFSTVAASIQQTVTQSMVQGGFSLQKSNLLSAAPGDPSISRTYEHTRSGSLAFTLGFERPGARLRLEVVSPSALRFTKTGSSTLTIDVPDAVAGSWTYVATPEVLPYPNYPFTLTVGAVSVVDTRRQTVATAAAAGPRSAAGLVAGNVRFRELEVGIRQGARAPRIAVTSSRFDDMGKLLRGLGTGYQFDSLTIDDLVDPAWLSRYDILFFTCEGWGGRWIGGFNVGGVTRPGFTHGTYNAELFERLYNNIRRFVASGGTLYASDLRYTTVAAAFPSCVLVPADLLTEVDGVETELLAKISPRSPIKTIAQAVDKASLTPTLSERRKQVVAALEGCMVDDATRPVVEDVVKSLRMGGVSPFNSDAQAIASTLQDRSARIARAMSGHHSRNTQIAITTLRDRLQSLRSQVATARIGAGEAQVISAKVVDPGLEELLGETVDLNFEATGWDAARFAGKDVSVLMSGEFKLVEGGRTAAPLLVKFPAGQGTVIFTSFHNETQNSRQEEVLLRYLVFRAVNAKEESLADKTMLSGGFSPAKRSLISHSSGQPSVTKTYNSPKGGPIRFALTFSGQGARLKFKLVAPTGQVYEKEASATIVVEATGAPPGEWQYTITSLQVPYENFPFSVAVGEVAASSDRP